MSVGQQYTQLYLPDPYIPYVGGLCEGFVEGTAEQASFPYKVNGKWTTDGVYPSAASAWAASNGNHAEQPPEGLRVPVFFTLGNNKNGHVALMLEDGRVASSTQTGWHDTAYIHPNLQDLIKVYTRSQGSCTYLGWSEYIGKRKIVEGGNMPTPVTLETGRVILALIAGNDGLNGTKNALAGEMDEDINKYFTGRELEEVLWSTYDTQQAVDYRQSYLPKADAALHSGSGKYTNAGQLSGTTYYIKEK